jgi:hypothetical protein
LAPLAERCSFDTSTGAAQKRFWREHTRHARALVEGDQQQVLLVGLADAGLGDAQADTGDGQEILGVRGIEADGHAAIIRGYFFGLSRAMHTASTYPPSRNT